MARHHKTEETPKVRIPEGFAWEYPRWIRTDRFSRADWRFITRILIGGFVGLLFGRVLGSLQGLLLQWIYEGAVRAAPAIEGSVGRVIHAVATALGTVFSPLLTHSPLAESLAEVRASSSGAASLLFVAQLHGSLNGLYEGLKPALGDRCQAIVQWVILSWGLLWRGITWPVRAVFFRPPSDHELGALLRDPENPSSSRALRRLLHRGLLPAFPVAGAEARALAAWPGKISPDKRPDMWWTKPSLRVEVYRWLGSAATADGLSLLARGLHDPDDEARQAAVSALAAQGTLDSVPYLVSLLQEAEDARTIVVQGLKRCADIVMKAPAAPKGSPHPTAKRPREKGSP